MKRFLLALFLLSAFAFAPHVLAQTSGEAIGVRVIPNPKRQAPLVWYRANVPNPGNPVPMEVDGYPAVRDGRSVYVSATNYDAGSRTLYSNIYLISYSDTANEQVQAVFNEFLKQVHFNTNITDLAVREQIRRDVRRANDLTTMQAQVEDYKLRTGTYPRFEGGSYLPNTTYSTWPSWQATFGNLLGTALPVDPRNEFIGCSAPYDAKTCWSVEQRKFACTGEAYVYGYRVSNDGLTYSLFTTFEYEGPGNWQTSTVSQQSADQCFNFTASDASDTDADGVAAVSDNCPGISNPDQRDTDRDKRGDACDACPSDPTNDQDNDGICGNADSCPTISNTDQTDTDSDGIGNACDFQTCGNNITEGTEVCDGQSGVKAFEQCAVDCRSIRSQAFCGDGTVQTPNEQGIAEECDGTDVTEPCADEIGTGYTTRRVRECRATCRLAPFSSCQPTQSCGDGIINGAPGVEACDGLDSTGDGIPDPNGQQCQAGYGQQCQYCNHRCKKETTLGPRCGDGIVQAAQGEVCDEGVNNGKKCTPAYGKTCTYCGAANTDAACKLVVENGPSCGDNIRQQIYEECDQTTIEKAACTGEYQFHDRSCLLTQTGGRRACTWGDYGACYQDGSCGDGILNGREKCDDAKSPGICEQCQIKNNSVEIGYTVQSRSPNHTFCLGPKAMWVDDDTPGCEENYSTERTLSSPPSNSLLAAWVETLWELPIPLDVHFMRLNYHDCGLRHLGGYSDGNLVFWKEFWFQAGKHCDHGDRGLVSFFVNGSDFNGAADKVGTTNEIDKFGTESSGGYFLEGGYLRGRIKFGKSQTITTNEGIKVLEQLNNRRWQNNTSLPSDTYELSVSGTNVSKVLVWFGSSPITDPSSGLTTTTNSNSYVLGCVDNNTNQKCDFLEVL